MEARGLEKQPYKLRVLLIVWKELPVGAIEVRLQVQYGRNLKVTKMTGSTTGTWNRWSGLWIIPGYERPGSALPQCVCGEPNEGPRAKNDEAKGASRLSYGTL